MTMHGYNFTERVRKVLAMAREEAARLRHEYIGTEHMLLGLLREGEGVAATVLHNLDVDLDVLERKIDETVKKGQARQTTGPDLPYTSRAKKVLELAMDEARSLNHAYVGTEHLLLGMLAEERGIAAQLLVDSGATLNGAREETLRILGTEVPGSARSAGAKPTRGWPLREGGSPSASMAAAVIETLVRDAGVARVFAAQGIDVRKLTAALRDLERAKPDVERSLEPPGDSPPPA